MGWEEAGANRARHYSHTSFFVETRVKKTHQKPTTCDSSELALGENSLFSPEVSLRFILKLGGYSQENSGLSNVRGDGRMEKEDSALV